MKYFKLLTLFLGLVIGFSACDEDESVLDDSRPLVKFHFQLINVNPHHCHAINSITYIVEEDDTQSSYDVINNGSREFNVSVRKGELIGFTAFDTNDPTNTLLAAANIPTDNYDESPVVNNVQVYFTRCPLIDKILWVSF